MTFTHNKSYALLKLYSRLPADVKGHSVRVAIYMQILMEQVLSSMPELYPEAAEASEDAVLELTREIGVYHDIGKVKVPSAILNKKGALTEEERAELKLHTTYIDDLLTPMLDTLPASDRPFFTAVTETGRSHHEYWNGEGYPNGLKGEEIPFLARICAVCDAYDAMTSTRMYSPAISGNVAAQEIIRCAGTQFDPAVIKAFSLCHRQFTAINRAARV